MAKLNLDINEKILQNERLAKVLRIYAGEIDRLERFRLLLREHPLKDSRINLPLIQNVDRKIDKAVKMFRLWNNLYEKDLQEGPMSDISTDASISEIIEHCHDIEDIFMRTSITSLWN